jgi:hypothetical protein
MTRRQDLDSADKLNQKLLEDNYRMQALIRAALPILRWYEEYGCTYPTPEAGTEPEFINNHGFIDDSKVYSEAKRILGYD